MATYRFAGSDATAHIGLPPQPEDEAPIDWAKMWGISTPTPAAPEPPKEKPLPTFHNRPRTYAKNWKDWEEQ